MNKFLLRFFETDRKQLTILLVISAIAGLIAQYLSYTNEYVYAYRDSIYRIDAARRFIDAVNPGFFNQLGTVWLPLPNIILLPFAAVDYLWQTGLAGSIVSFTAFLFNAAAIYLITKIITENVIASFAASIVYVLNPNILYFQTTAMSEQLFLTFFSMSILYILKWNKDGTNKSIVLSGLFTSFAACTRYDAWTFAMICAGLVFLISLKNKTKPFKSSFFYFLPTAIVIIWWFLHNYIYYNDPFEFSRGQFSTLYQLKYYESSGRLLTKYNLFLSLKIYYYDVLLYSGFFSLILFAVGLHLYFWRNKSGINTYLIYLTIIAIPTTLLLLYLGQIIIEIPQSEPQGYFNSRYGLYALPGIAVFTGYFIFVLTNLKSKIKYFLLLVPIILFINQEYFFLEEIKKNTPAIAEVEYAGYKGSITYNVSKYLKDNYDGGKILYDASVFALPPWTGIYLKDRITYHTFIIGQKAMENPVSYVNWVMFYRKSDGDKILNALDTNINFRNNYGLVYSENGLELYRKK